MWYFLIKQPDLKQTQYGYLQKKTDSVDIEIFHEPYHTFYIFEVRSELYTGVMNYLDREGVPYEAVTQKPKRNELLTRMRES